MRTIGDVSRLAGVSVRTLHYYDEIGLLHPSSWSEAGYRLYSHEDLVRLQEILGWRRLGFSLARVGELVDEPGHDHRQARQRQRRLLSDQIDQLEAMALALDEALTTLEHGTRQQEDTMFDGFQASEYEEEARERWGDTDAYRESRRRTPDYGQAEWRSSEQQSEAIAREFAELQAAGDDPAGKRARALAERHRRHISRWFYYCPPEFHRGLGDMYVADERFARNWNERSDGLAEYVHEAIAANSSLQPVR